MQHMAQFAVDAWVISVTPFITEWPAACLQLTLLAATLQAPLLAYNHFVETVCVLNDCQEGLHGGGLSMGSMSQSQAGLLSQSSQSGSTAMLLGQCNLRGSSEELRSKRDAIYT